MFSLPYFQSNLKNKLFCQVSALELLLVVAVSFSPKNTYLTTFQRPPQGSSNAEKNLKVSSYTATSADLSPEALCCCHATGNDKIQKYNDMSRRMCA